MPTEPTGRRPLKSRDLPFFKKLAAALARVGATPNGISAASIFFGCLAGAALALTAGAMTVGQARVCWLVVAASIQLRLIANLLDGMVAVEGRKGGPTGDLWNEAPDRISDAAIFIGAGYAAGSSPTLGWAAALVTTFVAYVRALGASVGAGQCFLGPQAKPHRMALMTALALFGALFPIWVASEWHRDVTVMDDGITLSLPDTVSVFGMPLTGVSLVLWLVIFGGLVTAWRRLVFIAAFLRKKPRP